MTDSSLLILEPPYQMARRLHETAPGLGAVALLDAVARRPSTHDVKGQMDVAPWCPLCIIADEDSGVRPTRRLPRTCVVFDLVNEDGAAPILRAVASRPRPTPSAMVEWIVKRTKVPTVSRTLSDLFSRPALRRAEVGFLPYSVRDQLRLLGDWGPLEWQRVAVLVDLASDRTLLNRVVAADDAAAEDSRHWMRELLGTTEREFHARYGWEWVLESSLRNAGFFERRSKGVRTLHPMRAAVTAGAGNFAGVRATA
ncbi:MAG: hypothetical protein ABIZ91_01100 [Gemmatimonadaceae bacterium]